jgi:hypothetical protein
VSGPQNEEPACHPSMRINDGAPALLSDVLGVWRRLVDFPFNALGLSQSKRITEPTGLLWTQEPFGAPLGVAFDALGWILSLWIDSSFACIVAHFLSAVFFFPHSLIRCSTRMVGNSESS